MGLKFKKKKKKKQMWTALGTKDEFSQTLVSISLRELHGHFVTLSCLAKSCIQISGVVA